MTTTWDTLHTQQRHQLQYPNEHVVRFLVHHRLANPNKRYLLDIGCGAGRHLRLATDLGYAATGIDNSHEAITHVATRWLYAQEGDMRQLPYPDRHFDVALAIGAFYYGTIDDMQAAVNELYRVLIPRGRALVVLRSINDSRHNTYAPRTQRLQAPLSEEGFLCTFVEEQDIQNLFEAFKSIKLGVTETTDRTTGWTDSDLIITLTK